MNKIFKNPIILALDVNSLTKALSTTPSGADDDANIVELTKAIEFSENIGTISTMSQRMLNAANFVLDLRYAFTNSDWRRVGLLLTGISIKLLPDNVQPEVYRIRDNLLEHTAIENLNDVFYINKYKYNINI